MTSFPDHFSAVAARYAAYRPGYPDALVDALADLAAPAGATADLVAWDAGCGNGQLSLPLARRFGRVIATDPAAAQLALAPAHPRVEYRCEPAEASSLPAASAALVVAAQSAHWFDWPRFLAEAGRVAAPGALIALVSYGAVATGGAAGEVLHGYRDLVAPHWPPGRHHVDNGYRDLTLPWPAVPAPDIPMTVSWTRDELLGYLSSWSATARLLALEGPGPFEALGAALAASWPDDEQRLVRWPLAIRLARR